MIALEFVQLITLRKVNNIQLMQLQERRSTCQNDRTVPWHAALKQHVRTHIKICWYWLQTCLFKQPLHISEFVLQGFRLLIFVGTSLSSLSSGTVQALLPWTHTFFSWSRKKHTTEPAVSDSAFTSHRRKGSFNLSQDSIIAALDHVAYLSWKLWATTLKKQWLEELKAYIGTTIFGVNNFKTLNHANLWWFEQWCIVECSNGLKSPERKDCCPAFFFSVQSNLY